MSAPRLPPSARHSRCGGFTLVEMLVALASASLLGGLLISILASQSRFHLRNEDAVHASQIARALADGMGAEIRGASPGDLILATPDTVSFRFDVLRAVVCDTVSGGEADLFAFDSVTATNLRSSWRGTAVSGPYSADWIYADAFTPTSGVSAAAETACRASGADPANRAPSRSFRRARDWNAGFAVTPAPGSVARVYGRLTYAIRPSTSDPGTVSVRRNGQEFVTRLEPGAAFEYGLVGGIVQASVAAVDLPRVRQVRFVGTATGRNGRGAGRQMVYVIPLHN